MPIPDTLPVAMETPPLLISSAESSSGQVVAKASRAPAKVVGVCHIVPNGPDHVIDSPQNMFEPGLEMQIYVRTQERIELSGVPKITMITGPKFGTLKDLGGGTFAYLPNTGFIGKDRTTVLVELHGRKLQVIYFFEVIEGVAVGDEAVICGKKGRHWKISRPSDVEKEESASSTLAGSFASWPELVAGQFTVSWG